MNASTAIGIGGGILLIAITIAMSLEDPSALWDPLSMVVVLGGTLAAAFIAFPMTELRRITSVFFIVLRNEKMYARDDMMELVEVARTLVKADIRATEKKMESIKNPFLRLGIQLVVDGAPIEDIIDIMSWRIQKLRAKEKAEAQVFRAMASFAPAFGMIGTLLGLINMLGDLDQGMVSIGANMALAMITTLYGVIFANLLFKPIAMKFEQRTLQRIALMNTIMQGVILLRQKRSPGVIEETLETFSTERKDEISDPSGASTKKAR